MAFSSFADSANWAFSSATRRDIFSSKGSLVVLDFLGADVAARGEDVAVGGDFGGGGGFAEAGDVLAVPNSSAHRRVCFWPFIPHPPLRGTLSLLMGEGHLPPPRARNQR